LIGRSTNSISITPSYSFIKTALRAGGREVEIVRELEEIGSRNYQILLKLMARGARIMGTESPALLVEEYELSRQTVLAASSGRPTTRAQREASDRILEQRDCFIETRIDETLLPGATGLVFLGLLHSLDRRLPDDIALTKLDLTRS
jgi:hypothetical protein